jgi:hypothetical protein
MLTFQAMSQRREIAAEKGMDHGEQKDQGAQEIERISFDSHAETLEYRASSIAITLQVGREVECGAVACLRRGCGRKAEKQYG